MCVGDTIPIRVLVGLPRHVLEPGSPHIAGEDARVDVEHMVGLHSFEQLFGTDLTVGRLSVQRGVGWGFTPCAGDHLQTHSGTMQHLRRATGLPEPAG